MFIRWKWVILVSAGVFLAALWNPSAKKQLAYELQQARIYFNDLARAYEAWQIMFLSIGITIIVGKLYHFLFRKEKSLWVRMKSTFFKMCRKLPMVRAKIETELNNTRVTVEKRFLSPKPNEPYHLALPSEGLSHTEVLHELDKMDSLAETDWSQGWVSGCAYNCNHELTRLTSAVFSRYPWANPLHLDIFPHVRKMEAEVVQWCVRLFNGGPDACGTMTTGGTESILMAMRVYRQVGFERGIEYPEIVCPMSAHCAFEKAAEYFRMKLVRVPLDQRTMAVNVRAMARHISSNTVVLVGSAPQFPHGAIDPIQEIAQLGCKHGVGVHVDCCLGGFLVPFMDSAGYPLDPVDFRVKGVTSISADTHKYGFTTKGSSVIMYASQELRRHQFFIATDWQGGIYATPTSSGSRMGSVIAATWAVLLFMGLDGYVESTKKIVSTTKWMVAELRKIPGIYILGKPEVSVFAIASKEFNIFRLSSAMNECKWNLGNLQFPSALHLSVTMLHTQKGVAQRFINDVTECVREIMKNPKAEVTGSAAMYGLAQALPDRSIVADIAVLFLETAYKTVPPDKHD